MTTELDHLSHAEDARGNLLRARFFRKGFGIYFSRIGNGPRWRVEVYERDDEPDERSYVFGRDANRLCNAFRLLAAWWAR